MLSAVSRLSIKSQYRFSRLRFPLIPNLYRLLVHFEFFFFFAFFFLTLKIMTHKSQDEWHIHISTGPLSTWLKLNSSLVIKEHVYFCAASHKHLGTEESSCWSFGRVMRSNICLTWDSSCSAVWAAVRPSTEKTCCFNGCSMWFSIVLLKYARHSLKQTPFGWEHMLL